MKSRLPQAIAALFVFVAVSFSVAACDPGEDCDVDLDCVNTCKTVNPGKSTDECSSECAVCEPGTNDEDG